MSLYWFTFCATFALIMMSETYRCKRMTLTELIINFVTALIPGVNVLVAILCVHYAINS